MKNIAITLQHVGEKLQAQYGESPIPIEIIQQEAFNTGGYKKRSIMPSDFCYNSINQSPVSMTSPMFIKVGKGLYQYLGLQYPFSGQVLWEPKGEPVRIVGEWVNGICTLINDPRTKETATESNVYQYPLTEQLIKDDSGGWREEELKASVAAYVEMQHKERVGEHFIKKRYYENLAATFGRTEKAFEYRMQNISYVLSLMGRNWLSGLKPAKNVGARVAAEIENFLNLLEGKKSIPVAAFEIEVREEASKANLPKPIGNASPKTTSSEVTQFQRDASVKAWILKHANGKCENCGNEAPFMAANGMPYLEVHHILQLADNGSDTISNAVALCPNCHREFHYSGNSQSMISQLYERIGRLVRE